MMMDQSNLSTLLQGQVPTDSESVAAQNLAEAYATYAIDAEANLIQILAPGVAAGKAAMLLALVGLSVPDQSATIIQAAVAVFWAAAVVPGWPTQTGSTPQIAAGLATVLAVSFANNTAFDNDLATAAGAVAGDIHAASSNAGGTVTFPGPVVATIL
jgi:hypothetical protein